MSGPRAIMVDLETLATASNAAITQVAAVEFDLNTGTWNTSFNAYVSGGFGACSRDTALWWMSQPSAADFASRVAQRGEPLKAVLTSFTAWVLARTGLPLYAHGGAVDFPVLRASYEACEMVPPWSYRAEMCVRSLYAELWDAKAFLAEVPLPEGYVKHDALSDCQLQIAQLVAARRELGLVQEAA